MTSDVLRRRRLVAAGIAAAVLILAVALAVKVFGGGDEPPAEGAAALAPKGTLVFVHLSTDRGRGATERADDLARRFDAYGRFRDTILQRLAGTGQTVRAKDVEGWLGDEAALALVDAGQATAGSLVIVKVTDAAKARAFLNKNPRRSAVRTYKGDRIDEFGTVDTAFKRGYLLIGQSPTVQAALDQASGRGASLASDPTYKDAMRGAPAGRVADAYVTADGLRRLLEPQGGVLGSAAVLLDNPALKAAAITASARDEGLRVRAHSILDPAVQKRTGGAAKAFSPKLVDAAPKDAMAYLGVSGISKSLGNLLAGAAGGANAGGVGPILEQLRTQLAKRTGGALERDLLGLFRGEVAIVMNRATPAPTLALVTRTEDEDATAGVLRRLQEPLVKLLTPKGEQAPQWRATPIGGGVTAQTLALPSGADISYAVFDGRLVLGTGVAAVKRIKDPGGKLSDGKAFKQAVDGRPDKVTALGFLDFSQLLELGEQTGLDDNRSYLEARDDLHRIRSIGISSHGGEGETTAEILLSIP